MNRLLAALLVAGVAGATPALAQDGHDHGPGPGAEAHGDGGGHQHWNGGGGRPQGAPQGQPGGRPAGAPQGQFNGGRPGNPPQGQFDGARPGQGPFGGRPGGFTPGQRPGGGDLRDRGYAGGDPVNHPGFSGPGGRAGGDPRPGDGRFDGRPGDHHFDGRPGDGRFDGRPGDGRFDRRPGDPRFDGRPGDGRFDGRPGGGVQVWRGRPDDRAPHFAGGPGGRGGDWNRGWRDDRRYDWQGWRAQHREVYRLGRYNAPGGFGYGYRRFGIGAAIAPAFFAEQYWIADPFSYRLPPAYGPYRWVRYYNDALLVNVYTGVVADVIPGFFY